MVCPLMSRAVTVSDYQNPSKYLVADMKYENCAKENCAWWVKIEIMTNVSGAVVHGEEPKMEDKGKCAIKLLATKTL